MNGMTRSERGGRRQERSSNREPHAIQHRCFPPHPDRCLLCGREGADLDAHPCLGHNEPTPPAP
jgi:hypothetical protein